MSTSWAAERPIYRPRHAAPPRRRMRRIMATTSWGALIAAIEVAWLILITRR